MSPFHVQLINHSLIEISEQKKNCRLINDWVFSVLNYIYYWRPHTHDVQHRIPEPNKNFRAEDTVYNVNVNLFNLMSMGPLEAPSTIIYMQLSDCVKGMKKRDNIRKNYFGTNDFICMYRIWMSTDGRRRGWRLLKKKNVWWYSINWNIRWVWCFLLMIIIRKKIKICIDWMCSCSSFGHYFTKVY